MAMAMAVASGASSHRPFSLAPISEPPGWSRHGQTLRLAMAQKRPISLLLARAQNSSSPSEQPSSPAPSPSPSSSSQEPKEGGEFIKQASAPSWAQPGSTEPPPWEKKASAPSDASFEVPFYFYLLASGIVAIAAIGSIFEYTNKKPIFGVIFPDSALYTPILGFFAVTGFPTAAFLWFKSISLANKAAREQDQEDGYYD